ncbi:MAG: hypothetical protein WKG07_02470 [Hymenobacter sp.]
MKQLQLAAQLPPPGQAQAVVELLLCRGIHSQLCVEELAQVPLVGRERGRHAEQQLLNQVQAFEFGTHG